jgi:3-methylfumaryl-CoA hydratase
MKPLLTLGVPLCIFVTPECLEILHQYIVSQCPQFETYIKLIVLKTSFFESSYMYITASALQPKKLPHSRFLPKDTFDFLCYSHCKVEFLKPLQIGAVVTRTSRILSISEKSGNSGQLVFVDVAHETSTENGLAVREVQSIVYREAAGLETPLSPPVESACSFDANGWDSQRVVVPNEPMLFRYSALTFNSHRIHYDLPYAREEERYRGLVVHGPLTASLLLDLARRALGDNALASFAFRGLSPAICGEALHLVMRGSGNDIEMAAFAGDGRQIMAASAQGRN